MLIRDSDIFLKVIKLYRPENTHKGISAAYQLDLNMLYWSDEGNLKIMNLMVYLCHINTIKY